MSDQQVVHSMP